MKDFAQSDATLNEINIDGLGRMVMALAQEMWVMRDRMAITEKLLEERAGIGAAEIEAYAADPATRAQIETLRDRFAAKILGAPVAGQERSVEQILVRAGLSRQSAPAAG